METISINKTTPYGVQLDDESYRNTTKPVIAFLKGKTPCEVEVLEMSGKMISKVRVLGPQQNRNSEYPRPEKTDTIERMSALNRRINARICALNNATELVKADAEIKKTAEVVLAYAADFLKFLEEQGE